jgi:Icc protein
MLIAQITDFHITAGGRLAYGRVDTRTALEACVARLKALDPQPDVILATGDLVDRGTAEEYGLLRELLAPLGPPVLVIPGNHDERRALASAFAAEDYLPRERATLDYVVEHWPVRLVALDTIVPEAGHGALSGEQVAWLDARLAEQPERPTVVIMHHPPFLTGIGHMDDIGLLEGGEALGAVIARHSQVERILCGHLHRAIQVRWRGTVASTAPSTAHQVTLDLRAGGDATFILEPPGFQLHLWRDGVGLVSHTAAIGRHDGPYPFYAPS